MKHRYWGALYAIILFSQVTFAKAPTPKTIYSTHPHLVGKEIPVFIAAGKAKIWESGELAEGTLAREHVLNGIRLAKGTTVKLAFFPRLQRAIPPKNTVIWGLPIAAKHAVDFLYYGSTNIGGASLTLAGDVEVGGFPAAKGTQLTFRCENDHCTTEEFGVRYLMTATNSKPYTTPQGYSFPSETLFRFDSQKGQLREIRLKYDHQLQGYYVRASAETSVYRDGRLRQFLLGQATTIDGVPIGEDTLVGLHPSGRLSSTRPLIGVSIDGIPVLAGSWVHLSESGKLVSGELSRTFKIWDLNIPKHASVRFSPQGRLSSIFLNRDSEGMNLRGIFLAPISSVEFDNAGNHIKARLSKATEVDGLTLKARSDVRFFPNGQIRYASLKDETQIQGFSAAASSLVEFYQTGKLRLFSLPNATKIQGWLFRSGGGDYAVRLHRNGTVSKARLAETTVIQGVPCKATIVAFNSDGQLRYAIVATPVEIDGKWYDAGDVYRR